MSLNNGKELLSKAKWIWPQINFFDLHNTYAHFRKDFSLEQVPDDSILYITADQSYRLWINGKYVTRGPARGYQSHWPFDRVEVSRYLQQGDNYISVEVYNPGISTFGYIHESRAGLLCAGDFGNVAIRSDSTWISRIDPAHKSDTARYSLQINFQEHVDTSRDDRSWITSFSKPEGWKISEETAYGSMPWHDLEERGIPQLKEVGRLPEKLVSSSAGDVIPGYISWRNVVSGVHDELKKVEWKLKDNKIAEDGTIIIPAAGSGKFKAVILDMGETVIGPSTVSVEGGSQGTVLDFFYHEGIEENFGPVIPQPDNNGCRVAMGNRMILSGDKNSYSFYQLLGFRYITVLVKENIDPVSIRIEVADTGYPYAMTGGFDCSDKTVKDIWEICRRTEQVCSLDAYVDTPWREQAQWWGDARVQFWNTMAMDGDTRLFKRGIRSIAGQYVPNGLTYGHAPTMAHNCILPDFSLVWIMTVYDYYRQTKDISIFEEQLPRINEVLSYFEKEAPINKGLLGYDNRYWLFLDWSDLEKEGAPTLYNMWYLLALRTIADMHGVCGHTDDAKKIRNKSMELQKAIEELLFDAEAGLFRDGIDNAGNPSKKHSVHSQTFAVMLGLKPESHKNMFDLRILPFLRGEKLDVPVPSTYWTSYVLTAARENGFFKEVLDFIKRMWTPMIPLSTCPEIFDGAVGDSSYSHAWSAHPVFHLMNLLGGVVQDSAGWDTIIFEPYFTEDLDNVHVKHPTPYGPVESGWERIDGKIKVLLKLPEGVTAKVKIPGHECTVCGDYETLI